MKNIHKLLRRTILDIIDFFYVPFQKHFPLQTFRYIACGSAVTVLDICLFSISYNFVLRKHDSVIGQFILSPYIASLFLSFSITLPFGFYLNRYVVFPQSGLKGRSQLARFVSVTALSVFLNYIFLKIFVEYCGLYPSPAKIITTLLVVVFSYVSQTYFLFRANHKVEVLK